MWITQKPSKFLLINLHQVPGGNIHSFDPTSQRKCKFYLATAIIKLGRLFIDYDRNGNFKLCGTLIITLYHRFNIPAVSSLVRERRTRFADH